MQTLTKMVIDADLDGRVFHDSQLAVLLAGTAQRRYNLVNRALAADELVRLARGVYVVHPRIAGTLPHAFVVAQHLRPGSFISFEAALAWHGCIPEAVKMITSVVPGRRKAEYSAPLFGDFRFTPLAQQRGYGLVRVQRVELTGGVGLVGDPLRALLDLICWRRVSVDSLSDFLHGLRLEPDLSSLISSKALERLRNVYLHRRMGEVIDCLDREYAHD